MSNTVPTARSVYVTNGSGNPIAHGSPVKVGQRVGIAIKQVPVSFGAALSENYEIADGEEFLLRVHGQVEVDGTFTDGAAVYLRPDGDLAANATSDEIQQVVVDATSGTFTLSVSTGGVGNVTGSIAYNASAATVKTALEGTDYIAPGDVAVSKPSAGTYIVTFGGALADTDVDEMTADASGLSGGTHSVTITTLDPGDVDGAPFGRTISSSRGRTVIDLDAKTSVDAAAF